MIEIATNSRFREKTSSGSEVTIAAFYSCSGRK
jgi:hypothetical protein